MMGLSQVLENIQSIKNHIQKIQSLSTRGLRPFNTSGSFQKQIKNHMNASVSNVFKTKPASFVNSSMDNNAMAVRHILRRQNSGSFSQWIQKAGKQYKIPDSLIKSIIHVESAYNPNAVSSAGAKGLMQLMPKTAKELGVTDIFNPKENIFAGTKYLRGLLDQFEGNLPHALAAYNAGFNRVIKSQGIPEIRETKDYVKRVMDRYRKINQGVVEGLGS